MRPGSRAACSMLKMPPSATIEAKASSEGAKRVTLACEARKAVVLEAWPRRLRRVERLSWVLMAVARSGACAVAVASAEAKRKGVLVRIFDGI
jgi:hypothetical protein